MGRWNYRCLGPGDGHVTMVTDIVGVVHEETSIVTTEAVREGVVAVASNVDISPKIDDIDVSSSYLTTGGVNM